MVGLSFTIGSLLFILLLLISYYSQQRFNSARNKLYRLMLIEEIILLITEIVAGLYLAYGRSYAIALLFHRIHWITGMLYGILLFYYIIVFARNLNLKKYSEVIKTDTYTKSVFIIFIILFFVYFFIPFETLNPYNVSYIPGPAAYYVLLYCAFSVTMLIIYVLIHRRETSKRAKIAIFIMMAEVGVLFLLQILIPTIAFSGLATSMLLFILYFLVENPDLKIIREVEKLKNEAEKSNKAKTDFLSNMSHEIRSPMNAIVGFSESILKDKDMDINSLKNDISNIYNAGNNLLGIINNILDISKIEAGSEKLILKEYNLSDIIIDLSNIVESRLSDKNVKLVLDINENIPRKLYGDATKIYQILLNILTNAVKYTEVGKIKFSVSYETNNDLCNLKFRISDTGYGIKKEDFDKLFEKFSRLDSATSNEIEGTGLGLVITKKYVDLLGGKIWFDSEYEVGTNFYVELSQKIIDPSPIGNISGQKKEDNTTEYLDCSNYKVLIVDDNNLNLKVASRILQRYNFNITTCNSGENCIYRIKSGEEYDIIFMDHMMPEMDGIQTLHILKKLEGYTIPIVVVLTANAIAGMREMYLNEGFDDYLSKPINIQELNKIILKYFNKKEV